MTTSFLKVKLKRGKTKAGIVVCVATYPNGKIVIFKNTAIAKKQIKFEDSKDLIK